MTEPAGAPAVGPDGSDDAPAGSSPGEDWRARRREAADAHAAALAARQAAESARAREMIAGFVVEAGRRGVPAEPLRAQGYGGRGSFRTGLQGWYLRRDRTVAVGTDGEFYVLTVPGGIAARWRGVTPAPQDPPLVIGAGGKDGESLDLDIALARVLGDA